MQSACLPSYVQTSHRSISNSCLCCALGHPTESDDPRCHSDRLRRYPPGKRMPPVSAYGSPVSAGPPAELPAACNEMPDRHEFGSWPALRSEEHTSELQSHVNLVCRLLLEKKKKKQQTEQY